MNYIEGYSMKKVAFLLLIALLLNSLSIYSMEQEKVACEEKIHMQALTLEPNQSTHVLGVPTFFDRLPKELLELLRQLIIENNPDVSRHCWKEPTTLPGRLIGSFDDRALTVDKTSIYIWYKGKLVRQISLGPVIVNMAERGILPICNTQLTKFTVPCLDETGVSIYDAISGSHITTLLVPFSILCHVSILCRAFSNDGKKIISISPGNMTKLWDASLWDATHGILLATLKNDSSGFYSAEFNQEDTLILTVLYDNTARIYDAGNGVCKKILNDPKNHAVSKEVALMRRAPKLLLAIHRGIKLKFGMLSQETVNCRLIILLTQ